MKGSKVYVVLRLVEDIEFDHGAELKGVKLVTDDLDIADSYKTKEVYLGNNLYESYKISELYVV